MHKIRTHQIMANTGFSDITITQGNMQVFLPQHAVKKNNGAVKKEVCATLMDIAQMTIGEATYLNKTYGVEVTSR